MAYVLDRQQLVGPPGRARARAARRWRVMAPVVVATTLGLFGAGLVVGQGTLAGGNSPSGAVFALVALVVGLVLAWHMPGNPIGWLMLAAPGFIATFLFCQGVATSAQHHEPLVALGFFAATQFFYYNFLFSAPVILLLFPEGKLPSPRWKWVLRSYLALAVGVQVLSAAAVVPVAARPRLRWDASGNPVPGPSALFTAPVNILVLACLLLALAWVAGRIAGYRRSTGVLRQQFKWLALGSAALLVALAASFVTPSGNGTTATVLNTVTGAAGVVFPLTVGIAVLRWRLYDIDRVVSRTLSYAVVTGLLVAVYLGMVALTTQALPLSSAVGVAASTLVAAALFAPVRRRVQRAVDRRFNRVRYDAERTVDAFAGRLRDVVGLKGVTELCLETVDRAVEPRALCLWVAPVVPRHDA